jgi:DNA polymerase-1
LSQDLSITRKEADQYIKQYFQSYPGIKTFLDDAIAHAKENGYVVTLYGRRRPIPELKSSNFMQRSFGERVAMNAPIQGTAADIMKIAMIGVAKQLKERGLRSRLILQVHDELLIEAHQEELEQVQEILVRQMEDAANLFVPLVVDMHTGNTWYDAK